MSPEAQRQRGASGSSYTTPVYGTPGRQRLSFGSGPGGAGGPGSAGGAAAGGVQELGSGGLAQLGGCGSSLALVAASRQALALYAGGDGEASRLPRDWQRLHKDRDMRVRRTAPTRVGCELQAFHTSTWRVLPQWHMTLTLTLPPAAAR